MGSFNQREYHRAYRLKNAAILKEKKRLYYLARREGIRQKHKEYRAKNLAKLRAYDKARKVLDSRKAVEKAYRERNKEVIKSRRAGYWGANASRKRAYDMRYRDANAEGIKKRQLAYYDKNKPAYVARVVKRNAVKRKACPAWANEFFMEEAYDLAARRSALKTGGHAKWHVDHIVPLQSPLVCGLHVHNNLRVIPGKENLAKGNRSWPDMP